MMDITRIQALATPALKAAYGKEADKQIFLEGELDAAGFSLSLTNRPDQWDRVIGCLEDALNKGETV